MLYAHICDMFNLQSPAPAQVPNITLASYSFRKRQALRFWRQALSKHFEFRTLVVRSNSLCHFTMGSCALTIPKPSKRAQRCHRHTTACAKLSYYIDIHDRADIGEYYRSLNGTSDEVASSGTSYVLHQMHVHACAGWLQAP
jgi:hypothetical protein